MFRLSTVASSTLLKTFEKLEGTNKLADTLLPIDSALVKLPSIELTDEEAKRIQNGLKVSRRDIPTSDMIRMYSENEEFIGIGRYSSDHQLAAKRIMRTN